MQRRGQHPGFRSAIEPPTREAEPAEPDPRRAARNGVGQLDLSARAGFLCGKIVEDPRIENVAPHDRLAGRCGLGRGFFNHSQREVENPVIGNMPIDAIFSPVRRVSFAVEPTRVGQSTDHDRLVLDVTTDGSTSPSEAMASAGETLRTIVALVAELSDEPKGLALTEEPDTASSSPDLDLPIEDLDLSERPRNCLKRAQVNTVGELLMKSHDDLLNITNFGQKSLDEVIEKLDERGLSLRP